MKSELDLLIELLQKESDYLKSEMERCVEDNYFLGAEAFRKPLFHTIRKLEIAKSLKDPNHRKISRLEKTISAYKDIISSDFKQFDFLGGLKEKTVNASKKSYSDRIEKSKNEIEKLQKQKPKSYVDDDQILTLLEDLENLESVCFEFNFFTWNVHLEMRLINDHLIIRFLDDLDQGLHRRFGITRIQFLKVLGFDDFNLEKKISDYKSVDKLKILELISIIFFEVFQIEHNHTVRLIVNSN